MSSKIFQPSSIIGLLYLTEHINLHSNDSMLADQQQLQCGNYIVRGRYYGKQVETVIVNNSTNNNKKYNYVSLFLPIILFAF
jgi:hypothetical protein